MNVTMGAAILMPKPDFCAHPVGFFNLIESLCLFDRVFAVAEVDRVKPKEMDSAEFWQDMAAGFQGFFASLEEDAVLQALCDEGLLEIVGPKGIIKNAPLFKQDEFGQLRGEITALEPTLSLYLQCASFLLNAAPVDTAPIALDAIHHSPHHHSTLKALYDALSLSLKPEVEQRWHCAYVPPLPLMVLQDIEKRSDLPRAIVHLRGKCRALREAIREWEHALRDNTLPNKAKKDAVDRVTAVSKSLLENTRIDIGLQDYVQPYDSLEVLKKGIQLLPWLAQLLKTYNHQRQFGMLFEMRDEFYRATEYRTILRRLQR